MNSLLRPDRRQGGVVMLGCVWEPSCLFSFLSFRYLGVLFVHRTSLSFSRTQKDREIKWCRVSPRGLNVSARARASYFFVVALNNVGQTHASSRTNDSHTHPRKKKTETKTKKSLTWSPCQSHTSAREFNNSSIRLSLRNPLHSSRDTLAFSLTYINMSLEDHSPPPSLCLCPFFLLLGIVLPFALVIAGYLGSESGRPIHASCWGLTLWDGNRRFGRFCPPDKRWKERESERAGGEKEKMCVPVCRRERGSEIIDQSSDPPLPPILS